MELFVYTSLPTGMSFRYLVLKPGLGDDPLSGSLRTVDINGDIDFDAISYVWGAPHQVSEIACDGRVVRLTASLRDALRRARLPDTPRHVWADQICINQVDLAERSQQVTLMARIYAKSNTTLVYLGGASEEETRDVASLVDEVNTMLNAHMGDSASWENVPHAKSTDPIVSDDRWKAVAQLTRRPWFDRVWVVQEAGLSVKPQILYGDLTMPWESLFRALKWVQMRATAIAYNLHLDWHGIHMDRQVIWSGQKPPGTATTWSFLDILHASRQLQATEARDHLFGFLGHPAASHKTTGQLIVMPDYTQDVTELHFELARKHIEWTQNLDILSFVQEAGRLSPSWVPNWVAFDGSVLAQLGEAVFSAGGRPNVRTMPLFLNDGKKLRVEGVMVGEVQFLSEPFADTDFSWARTGPPGDEGEKWAGILAYVLDPTTPYLHVEQSRLLSCGVALTAGISQLEHKQLETGIAAFVMPYSNHIKPRIDQKQFLHLSSLALEGKNNSDGSLMEAAIAAPLINRRFVVTKNGRYGLAPVTARPGDGIWVLFGAKTPFVLRRTADSAKEYSLAGECFGLGLMDGEYARKSRKDGQAERALTLV